MTKKETFTFIPAGMKVSFFYKHEYPFVHI